LVYQRRRLTIFRTQKAFPEKEFDPVVLDEPRRMFRFNRKRQPGRPEIAVLSHCCIHDPDYIPALEAYRDYLRTYAGIVEINWRLCVYDYEETLSDPQKDDIRKALNGMPFELVHHVELPVLLPLLGIK